MAARVALLLAFTGFFAVAWESDRQPGMTLATAKDRLPEPLSVAQESARFPIISQINGGITISSESDFSCCVLPEEILPGTYRVVDERGLVGWITIPSDIGLQKAPTQNDSKPQKPVEVFVSHSSSGHWYFVRVNAAPILATPRKDHSILR